MSAKAVAVAVVLSAAFPAAAEVVRLTSVDEVRKVCDGLRPLERVRFSGDAPQRAKAQDAFEAERDRLVASEFSVEIPWGGFRASEWDPKEKVVTVSSERAFKALGGALTVFDVDRDRLELEAAEGAEAALQAALAKGSLVLSLVFQPAEADESPCSATKANAFVLSVDFRRSELLLEGKVLARATRDGLVRAGVPGKPTVEIRAAPGEAEKGPQVLVAGVLKVKPSIERCYAQALAQKPGLDGALVLGLEVGMDGRLVPGTVVADSLQDPDLAACVKKAVGRARASPRGLKGMIAIHLQLAESP